LHECPALVIVPLHEIRIVGAEEETMIAGFLLGLLTDIVFASAASLRRSFESDMGRYFDRRGFAQPVKRSGASTR